MKNLFIKKIAGLATTAALTVASISSAFADVTVENYEHFGINNSVADTVVKQSASQTNINGCNINIKDVKSATIDNSLIGTYIDSSQSEINAAGKDIKHVGVDLTKINNSIVGTALKEKIEVRNFVGK